MALCAECGVYFSREPDEGWKKLCISCWKKNKFGSASDPKPFRVTSTTTTSLGEVMQKWGSAAKTDRSYTQAIEDDNKRLRSVNCGLRDQLIVAQDKLRTAMLEIELERSIKRPAATEAKNFLSKNIKSILMLVHPDRHKNSKQATEITSWLIKFKKDAC